MQGGRTEPICSSGRKGEESSEREVPLIEGQSRGTAVEHGMRMIAET
jgi:hypothetical protein